MNRLCKTGNIEKVQKNHLKDRTVCKSCLIIYRKKNNDNNTLKQNRQPQSDNNINNINNSTVSTYENHAFVIIGPRNLSKFYYMLEKVKK